MLRLEGKNVVITGGAGFIGSNLANELASRNRVRIVDNLSSGKLSNIDSIASRVEFYETDIGADISNFFKDIDIVFHEGANPFIANSIQDPSFDARVNVMGTLAVLEACRQHKVKRLVFASSSSVYGDPIALPVIEDHPFGPKSPYAVSKIAGEYYCRIYYDLYGLETVCLRYFNVYGENQRPDNPYSGVIAIFAGKSLRDMALTILGDGEQTRDFVHVQDVVCANILAALSKRAVGRSINIGTGVKTSLNQLVGVLGEVTGKKPEVIYASPRPGDVKHSVSDISLARDLLGYEPSLTLREGLARLLCQIQDRGG